jgi:hypothetical protein
MPHQDNWPEWWDWPLAFTGHIRRRMIDRGFDETGLREMLTDAFHFARDTEPGRWFALARWQGCCWKVVVEPNFGTRRLVVITAYMLE